MSLVFLIKLDVTSIEFDRHSQYCGIKSTGIRLAEGLCGMPVVFRLTCRSCQAESTASFAVSFTVRPKSASAM